MNTTRLLCCLLLAAAFAIALPRPCFTEDTDNAGREREALKIMDDLEKGYPYFDLKGIKKDWDARKKDWKKRARELADDKALIALVAEFTAALRDGSMVVESALLPEPEKLYCSGMSFVLADNKVMVVTGSAKGSEVVKINGVAAKKWLETREKEIWEAGGSFSSPQQVRAMVWGFPGLGPKMTEMEYVLKGSAGGQLMTKSVFAVEGRQVYPCPETTKATPDGTGQWCVLDGGVGYVKLKEVGADTDRAVDSLIQATQGSSGWIVDISDCVGGGRATLAAATPYQGKIAVIISNRTAGHAERYAKDMVNNCGARLIGEPTAGCLSIMAEYPLPRELGKILRSEKSEKGNAGDVEYKGIQPQIRVQWSSKDIAAGRSSFIEEAVRQFAKPGK